MAIKFTDGAKSTIDIVLPVAGAGYAFYYMSQKKKADMQKTVITALVVAVGLYIITTQITKRLLSAAEKPDNLPVPNDVPGQSGGGTTVFDAGAWSKRLYDDIKPTNFFFGYGHDAKLYEDMVLLSNGELIAIYNAWNDTYYSKYGNRSLTQAMKAESYPNMFGGTNDKAKIIIQRLASLGAN